MKRIKLDNIEVLLEEMKEIQLSHPKATIYFIPETYEIDVRYPLPEDFKKL